MNQQVTNRYNKRSVAKIIEQLEAWIESTQDALDNTSSEARQDELSDRLDSLESARDLLQELADA